MDAAPIVIDDDECGAVLARPGHPAMLLRQPSPHDEPKLACNDEEREREKGGEELGPSMFYCYYVSVSCGRPTAARGRDLRDEGMRRREWRMQYDGSATMNCTGGQVDGVR